jgi:hypothetical protein
MVGDAAPAEVHVLFSASCSSADSLKRLEGLPPEGLVDSPPGRVEDVVSDPNVLRRTIT